MQRSVRKHAQDLDSFLRESPRFQTSILVQHDDGTVREAEIWMDRKRNPRCVGYVHVSLHKFPKPDPTKLVWDSSKSSASLSVYTCCPASCPDDIAWAFDKLEKRLEGYKPLLESVVVKSSKPGKDLYKMTWSAWCELFGKEAMPEPKNPDRFRDEQLKDLGITSDTTVKPKRDAVKAKPQAKVNSNFIDTTALSAAPLIESIEQCGLSAVRDQLIKLARPILAINSTVACSDDGVPIGASKLGGLPDLPDGFECPRCNQNMAHEYPAGVGGRLGFLAQFALKDLANMHVAQGLPDDGLLSFFAYQSDGYQPGVAVRDTGDTRVFYFPAAKTLMRSPEPDDLDEYNGAFPACSLKMSEAWDLPSWSDVEIDEYADVIRRLIDAYAASQPCGEPEEELLDRIQDLRNRCNVSKHHLLGYSIHNRTGEPSPGADWLHLLCLSSDENLGWNWCDGEHLSIFVHQDDVDDRSFTRAFGYAS